MMMNKSNPEIQMPLEYRWLKANGFKGFEPWYLIDDPGCGGLRGQYQKETGDDFYPFARRGDCDDVAGFKVVDGEIQSIVVNVHLTWSSKREQSGFPRRSYYEDMFEWLELDVIPITKEWMLDTDPEDFE